MAGLTRRTAAAGLGVAFIPGSAGAAANALAFTDLPGWAEDDHVAALRAFRRTCRAGLPRAAARATPDRDARFFFERWFDPVAVSDPGFLTGYFEPVFPGALRRDDAHRFPLLGPPPGLLVRERGPLPPGWPSGMTAALRAGGGFRALPDRGEIETGALGDAAPPVVWLADPVDAFTVHVQGSARVALAGGGTVRVGFAGRNGYPYTAIARIVADRAGWEPATATADRLWDWLKTNKTEAGAIMRANRSFIFFRRLPAADETAGPIGAAGQPLTAGRSLAVDPTHWAFGTPVWLEGEWPRPDGSTAPLRRLVVAGDAGAAIKGRARGDLFVGSGPEAGLVAARLRHRVRFVVLRPRAKPAR